MDDAEGEPVTDLVQNRTKEDGNPAWWQSRKCSTWFRSKIKIMVHRVVVDLEELVGDNSGFAPVVVVVVDKGKR